MTEGPKRYDAFVSYSHAADGAFAPSLQDSLQKLAKAWRQRRALEVFRDETGLSVNPALWTSICAAMDGAEYFVLLASPEAASSEWVSREIQRWVATKGTERIIPVVTSGEWVWDDDTGDFDWERSTAVPPALAGVYTSPPQHVDLTWAKDEISLTLRHARFKEHVARIAAPMHGTVVDELMAEDVRQQRRSTRLKRGAASLLAVFTLGAVAASGLAAVNQREALAARDDARQNRDEAERQARAAASQQLAADAVDLADADGDLALLLATQAVRFDPAPDAQATLERLLDTDVVHYLHGGTGDFVDVEFSGDGALVAAADGDGTLIAWDAESGERLFDPVPGDVGNVAWSADGSVLMAADLNDYVRFYGPTGALMGEPLLTEHAPVVIRNRNNPGVPPGCHVGAAVITRTCPPDDSLVVQADLDPSGELVAVRQAAAYELEVWDRRTAEVVYRTPRATGLEHFDDDSGRLLLAASAVDTRTGDTSPRPPSRTPGFCPNSGTYDGPQVFDRVAEQWAVVVNSTLWLVPHSAAQGPADNPTLACLGAGAVDTGFRFTAPVRGVDLTAGGLLAAATEQDAVVLVDTAGASTPRDDLAKVACEVAGRNLTRTEWSQYLPGWDYELTCPELPHPVDEPVVEEVADPSVPPTAGQIRAALESPAVTYLGRCGRVAYTFQAGRVAFCGEVQGHDDGQAVVAMLEGEYLSVPHYLFELVDGSWSVADTYTSAAVTVGPNDPPPPEWYERLVTG